MTQPERRQRAGDESRRAAILAATIAGVGEAAHLLACCATGREEPDKCSFRRPGGHLPGRRGQRPACWVDRGRTARQPQRGLLCAWLPESCRFWPSVEDQMNHRASCPDVQPPEGWAKVSERAYDIPIPFLPSR